MESLSQNVVFMVRSDRRSYETHSQKTAELRESMKTTVPIGDEKKTDRCWDRLFVDSRTHPGSHKQTVGWVSSKDSLLSLAIVFVLTVSQAAADRIELEVMTLPGAAPAASHDWMEALKQASVDRLRLQQATRSVQPSIESVVEAGETIYSVRAVVSKNRLVVPGARFSRFEMDQFNDWLKGIAAHAAGDRPIHSYGMSAEQLLRVHKALKEPVYLSTKGEPIQRVVNSVAEQLTIGLRLKIRLPDQQVTEELTGLSSGTALAAALRPLGLVLVPVKTGAHETDVAVEVRRVEEAKESWPVGWPTKIRINKLAPKMLDFLDVEIDDTPLEEALNALQNRLEIPFLFDQNGMARQNIDPQIARVSFPARKTFYKKLLTNLLYQSKLKSELRVDEAGTPFLWISPVRK